MDDLGNKIIAGILVALLVFAMQSKKVHELIIGLFGGTAPSIILELLADKKDEGQFWASIDKCGSKDCYQLYLNEYPQGQFTKIARLQLGIATPTSKIPVAPPVLPIVVTPAPIVTPANDKGQRIEHYIVYKNGTAFDTKHKLLWMRCSVGQRWTGNDCSGEAKAIEWEDAKKQSADFAGYSDWRLPTIKELRTLVYCSNGSPDYFSMGKDFSDNDIGCKGRANKDHKSPTILQSVFPKTDGTLACSSSPVAYNAWLVYFYSGSDYWGSVDNDRQVRLVRSGQ